MIESIRLTLTPEHLINIVIEMPWCKSTYFRNFNAIVKFVLAQKCN